MPAPEFDINKLASLEERLYAPVEVAYILGLRQATVQRMCREKKIHALRPGRGWLITKAEIERYLREGPRKS